MLLEADSESRTRQCPGQANTLNTVKQTGNPRNRAKTKSATSRDPDVAIFAEACDRTAAKQRCIWDSGTEHCSDDEERHRCSRPSRRRSLRRQPKAVPTPATVRRHRCRAWRKISNICAHAYTINDPLQTRKNHYFLTFGTTQTRKSWPAGLASAQGAGQSLDSPLDADSAKRLWDRKGNCQHVRRRTWKKCSIQRRSGVHHRWHRPSHTPTSR